jgi:hypothetical protein
MMKDLYGLSTPQSRICFQRLNIAAVGNEQARAYHSAGALHDLTGFALTVELCKANPLPELLAIGNLESNSMNNTSKKVSVLQTYQDLDEVDGMLLG